MNKNVKDNSIALKALITVLAAFAVYKFSSIQINKVVTDDIMRIFISRVVLTVVALIAAAVTGRMYTLKWKSENLGVGLLVGGWFILQATFSLVAGIVEGNAVTVSALHVILFLVSMVMIGLGEELLFRGVLLNGMLDTFGEDSTKSIRTAVIISGCVFGFMHIFNVFSGAAFLGSLVQAVMNMPSGMLFGAVYVRAKKNIWPCIFIHAYVDTCSFFASGTLSGTTFAQVVSGYSPASLIIAVVELVIALFVMRDKKLLPLTKKA